MPAHTEWHLPEKVLAGVRAQRKVWASIWDGSEEIFVLFPQKKDGQKLTVPILSILDSVTT